MAITYHQCRQQLTKGDISPVYVLYGTESLLMADLTSNILVATLPDGIDEFNFTKMNGNETTIQRAIAEAETLPFLSERKVILVNNFSALTGAKATKVEHDLDLLLRYIENPSPHAILILVTYAEKLDERKKVTKALMKSACVISMQTLKEQECADWIQVEVSRLGVSITAEATEHLLLSVGTELQLLRNEIEKMALFAGDHGVIQVETVDQLASRTLENDVFVFVDHVVRVHPQEALQMLFDLLKNKEEPIKLLFLIARQVRMMYQVKSQTSRGYTVQQVASQVGGHPYAFKIASEQARLYTERQLAEMLSDLADIDYKIKTGKLIDRSAIEMFILTIKQRIEQPDIIRY